jgi:hypothetical protein
MDIATMMSSAGQGRLYGIFSRQVKKNPGARGKPGLTHISL